MNPPQESITMSTEKVASKAATLIAVNRVGSVSRAAAAAGLSERTIRRWLKGDSPDPINAQKLARVSGLTLTDFCPDICEWDGDRKILIR